MSAIVLMLPLWVAGQNMDDALRYSRLFYQGTARFNGMSGAFTALGGDISAISLNPAAAGVFRSTEVTITPWYSSVICQLTSTDLEVTTAIQD